MMRPRDDERRDDEPFLSRYGFDMSIDLDNSGLE